MLIKLKLPEIIDPLTIVSGLRNGRESDAYIEGFNRCRDLVESLNQPLVRGMEIDVEAFAKKMFEICTFPEPTPWEGLNQKTQDRWKLNAVIIGENAHVWLKEKDSK